VVLLTLAYLVAASQADRLAALGCDLSESVVSLHVLTQKPQRS
jgi:hypothetical protein